MIVPPMCCLFAMKETLDEELEIIYEPNEENSLNDVPDVLGDIIISVQTAQAQSEEYGHSIEREIGFCLFTAFCIC